MITTRRAFTGGLAAAGALAATPSFAQAAPPADWNTYYGPEAEDHGKVYKTTNFARIDGQWRRQLVKYTSSEPQGTVVVDTREHHLYVIFENGTALRYGVGVGREGFQWFGRASVDRRSLWPDWTPPPEMLKRRPDLPRHMVGGLENPLGARAMYLGGSLFRIHGSNEPDSIGQATSSGCIRMTNEDVIDLYERVRVGTKVVVLR
jgi:lipoprotein-anchoring transpeptidase ErfK/SrfK